MAISTPKHPSIHSGFHLAQSQPSRVFVSHDIESDLSVEEETKIGQRCRRIP